MSTKSRFRLFISFVILFIVVSPFIIFWSQGYRLDLQTRSFVRVGGLYFKIIPSDVELTLESIGSRRLRSSLFQEGTLFNNLIPGRYNVTISREGYFPWSKTLTVLPLQVTKVTSVILFPTLPSIQTLGAFGVTNFWPLKSRDDTLYFTDETEKRLFRLEFANQGAKPQLILDTTQDQFSSDRITDIIPSPDGSQLLIKFSRGDTILANSSGAEIRSVKSYFQGLKMPKVNFERLFWHPDAKQKLVGITSNDQIWEINLASGALRRLLPKTTIIGFDQTGTLILDRDGNLYQLSPKKEGVEQLDQILLPKTSPPLRIYALSNRQYVILDKNDTLWHVEHGNDPRIIAQGVIGVWPYRDGSRIALVTKNQIFSVYFMAEIINDVRYPKGSLLNLGVVPQNLNDVFWLKDGWHVILYEPAGFEILEVDSRFPINRVTYPIAASRVYWKSNQSTLLYISQNELWSWRLLE